MNNLLKLPGWLLTIIVTVVGSLLTYAIYTGRPVEFLGLKIGSACETLEKPPEPSIAKIELWTIKGRLALKSYEDLRPELRKHLHELVLRVKPPQPEVDPDGYFKVKNVPRVVEGKLEEPFLEVYPIKELLSQGYEAEPVPIRNEQAQYGNDLTYRLNFDKETKTVTIMDSVSLKNPSKESRIPAYSLQGAGMPKAIE